MSARTLLAATMQQWGKPLSPQQLDQFDRYAAELLRWNQRTNLTTITEPDEIAVRHFLDSLALVRAWPDQPPTSLADIGTGAGFPGIPLKILWPELRLLLVESVGKKTEFLASVVDTLRLPDVEIQTARAEDVGHDPRYREQFAAVTARAVASLNVLAEYCLPLCRTGGVFIAPKSATIDQEMQQAEMALHTLGGDIIQTFPVQLPNVPDRVVIVVRKMHSTPAQYPRRTGVPTKRPL